MLYVNGRFLTQPLSGVQRFATEMTAALQHQRPGTVAVLGPQGAGDVLAGARAIGKRQGQAWEQLELPPATRDGTLINLGNTAPLRLRNQIVVIHDAGVFATPAAYPLQFRLWYRFAQHVLVWGGAQIVTISQFSRAELARHLGARSDDIAVISEGCDHMHAIVADRSILAQVPPGRFVLVVGNLAAHKNLAGLSALAARLAARNIALVVTGGLATGAFRSVSKTPLPQPACYVGRVSDGSLKALYEAAICLVFPSHYEGFGLPAIEAMACGCPVAAANIPALQEICGSAAIYFDPQLPQDIADTVCRLVDDAPAQATRGAAGRSHSRAFTWSRAATQLAAIADSVSDRATRRVRPTRPGGTPAP